MTSSKFGALVTIGGRQVTASSLTLGDASNGLLEIASAAAMRPSVLDAKPDRPWRARFVGLRIEVEDCIERAGQRLHFSPFLRALSRSAARPRDIANTIRLWVSRSPG